MAEDRLIYSDNIVNVDIEDLIGKTIKGIDFEELHCSDTDGNEAETTEFYLTTTDGIELSVSICSPTELQLAHCTLKEES